MKLLKELTVLYVDDDEEACKSLVHILKYYFDNVLIAYNGKEALEIYKKEQCHLLIVDYDMPIMNGYEFLSKVRKIDSEISAFIISSYDDKAKLKNAITLNLLGYLLKPYELSELKKILKIFENQVEKKCLLKYSISKDCYYDMRNKTIINKDQEEKLTSYEVKIFEYLLKNINIISSYESLLHLLNSDNQKSLVSLIYKINQKLPVKIIENVKDMGYRIKK